VNLVGRLDWAQLAESVVDTVRDRRRDRLDGGVVAGPPCWRVRTVKTAVGSCGCSTPDIDCCRGFRSSMASLSR
jgi:hypothetical protein